MLAISFMLHSCSINCVDGSGNVKTENRVVEEFTSIAVAGNGHIILDQNGESAIRIEADDNLLDEITTEVRGGKLYIKTEHCIKRYTKLNYYISLGELKKISLSGSGTIEAKDKIKSNALEVKISGSGEVMLSLQVNELKTHISGSGDCKYKGNVMKHNLSLSGSGRIEAFDLITEETRIDVSGSAEALVNATNKLNVDISGSGDVYYTGRPKIKSDISGSGSLNAKE